MLFPCLPSAKMSLSKWWRLLLSKRWKQNDKMKTRNCLFGYPDLKLQRLKRVELDWRNSWIRYCAHLLKDNSAAHTDTGFILQYLMFIGSHLMSSIIHELKSYNSLGHFLCLFILIKTNFPFNGTQRTKSRWIATSSMFFFLWRDAVGAFFWNSRRISPYLRCAERLWNKTDMSSSLRLSRVIAEFMSWSAKRDSFCCMSMHMQQIQHKCTCMAVLGVCCVIGMPQLATGNHWKTCRDVWKESCGET